MVTISSSICATLKPEWGVVYKQTGYIYPNVERHFITIDIELPKQRNLLKQYDPILRCDNLYADVLKAVCRRHSETVRIIKRNTYRRNERMNAKFVDMKQLLPAAKSDRDRRFALFPVISLFTGAVGFVNQYHMNRKITALTTSVDALIKNEFIMDKRMKTLYNNQVTLVQKTSKEFDLISNRLDKQQEMIVNVTAQVEQRFETLEATLEDITDFQSAMTAAIDQYSHRVYECYSAAESLLDAYYNGILDLLMGKLPRDLIGPTELLAILEDTSNTLRNSLPDYELLHKSLAHYYKKTDLVYDVVKNHLVVTIPILIKKSNQKLMPLYRVETCHVPYTVELESKEANGSFTKVKLEHDYIAILDSNFVEFTNAQMDDCISHDAIWTCDSLLLQTHQSKMSCLAAIYWDYDYEVIKGLCHFEYFHNVQPQPQILESEQQILMANLDVPWSFDCKNRNIPLRVKGSRYAVLTRDNICGCSILGSSFYIEEKLCKQTLDTIVLTYPVNAAVMAYHKQILEENHITNVSTLFPTPPKLRVPKLNITMYSDEDTLVKTNEGKPISLARVATLLKKQKRIFYDTNVKQLESAKFENWWDGENIAIGCAFVLAVIGSITGIIAIFNCARTHRMSSTIGAMLMQQMPKAQALPMFCKRDASVSEILPPLLVQLAISLAIYLTLRLMWKLYTRWSIMKIVNPNAVSIKTRNEVHMSFEIFNHLEYMRVYLFTVRSNPMFLTVQGDIVNMKLELELKKLYCFLSFDWKRSELIVKQEGQTLQLPKIAYVPLYNYRKLARLMKTSYGIRLVLTTDGITYVQSETMKLKLETDPTV